MEDPARVDRPAVVRAGHQPLERPVVIRRIVVAKPEVRLADRGVEPPLVSEPLIAGVPHQRWNGSDDLVTDQPRAVAALPGIVRYQPGSRRLPPLPGARADRG